MRGPHTGLQHVRVRVARQDGQVRPRAAQHAWASIGGRSRHCCKLAAVAGSSGEPRRPRRAWGTRAPAHHERLHTRCSAHRIWDLATRQQRAILEGHTAVVSCVAISPDGTRCLAGSYDDTIRCVGGAACVSHGTGAVLHPCKTPRSLHTLLPCPVCARPCSIWDLATAQRVGTLSGHEWGVTSVSYCPDGTTCVSGSGDETIRCGDCASHWFTRSLRHVLRRCLPQQLVPPALCVQCRRVWDLASCTARVVTPGIGSYINCVVASPVGDCCLSASWDDSLR